MRCYRPTGDVRACQITTTITTTTSRLRKKNPHAVKFALNSRLGFMYLP